MFTVEITEGDKFWGAVWTPCRPEGDDRELAREVFEVMRQAVESTQTPIGEFAWDGGGGRGLIIRNESAGRAATTAKNGKAKKSASEGEGGEGDFLLSTKWHGDEETTSGWSLE